MWSLTRYPEGETPPPVKTPEPWAYNDPRWPPIPTQDFSNLPRQQQGLHTKGFEFMRLSDQAEGLISNYHRLIDGYLAGLERKSCQGRAAGVRLHRRALPRSGLLIREKRGEIVSMVNRARELIEGCVLC